MKLEITRKSEKFVLKACPGCGDEWYAKRKQNRCTLCGCGLVMRTPSNIHLNWDQLKPEISRRELRKFNQMAGFSLLNQ